MKEVSRKETTNTNTTKNPTNTNTTKNPTNTTEQIISKLHTHILLCKKAKKHIPPYHPIDFNHFHPPNFHYITRPIQKYIHSLHKVGRGYKLYFNGNRVINIYIIIPSYKVSKKTSKYHKVQRNKTTKHRPHHPPSSPPSPHNNMNVLFKGFFHSIHTIISLFIKEKGSLESEHTNVIDDLTDTQTPLPFPTCSTDLSIYLYLTDLKKTLPSKVAHTDLKEENVNTGFTFGCSLKNQIYIYREEEWEKVLIHELIHAFGLDFASNDELNTIANKRAMSYFGINHTEHKYLRLYEAYTETWADILYVLLKNADVRRGQRSEGKVSYLMKQVRVQQDWAIRQYVKIMSFYGLNVISSTPDFKEKEKSLILKQQLTLYSYYILKARLLFNIASFFEFLTKTKDTTTFISIIEFVKTEEAILQFTDFVFDDLYRENKAFEMSVKMSYKKHRNSKFNNSLRMTI